MASSRFWFENKLIVNNKKKDNESINNNGDRDIIQTDNVNLKNILIIKI